MNRIALLVVALAACGGDAPPKQTNPGAAYAAMPFPTAPNAPGVHSDREVVGWKKPAASGPQVLPAIVPRPNIDFSIYTADFHDELRWPLAMTSHPTLEPTFAIAQALAEPGVSLDKLCSLGAQSRHGVDLDLAAYLRGWCSALDGDVDAACSNLAPLIRSATPSIGAAVKIDLANILADHGHADDAERWLNRHRISNVEVLDRLAATYVETGSADDAIRINRIAIETDDRATLATRCTRMTRALVLAGNRESLQLGELRDLAEPHGPYRGGGDRTCKSLFHRLQCWAGNCKALYSDLGTDEIKMSNLRDAYERWPNARTVKDWRDIANMAKLAFPIKGATALSLAAFENEMGTDPCSENEKQWLEHSRIVLIMALDDVPELGRQYQRLLARCN